ncbi:MAG: ankyrin repeat domain-containing protein [Filimonas sp.]|nr:ankyrin repeat domain-containing protein [Filimonas sp.]
MYTPNKAAEAIFSGKFDEAKTLLANGETLTGQYVENNKSQLFSSVLRHKAFDMVDYFISAGQIQTDIYEMDNFDRSFFKNIAMEMKEEEESIAFLRSFLNKVENKNDEIKDQTLLGYFLETGASPVVIKTLIEVGCDARYKNNAERSFLHTVVNKNMLAEEKGHAYLEVLVGEGLDVNEKDIVGETPLMMAVKSRKRSYIDYLLQNGANSGEQDKKGKTAFYFAAAEQFDPEIFGLLCEYGTPDFDSTTTEGVTLFGEFMRMMRGGENELRLLDQMINAGASLTNTSLYYGQPKSAVAWLAEKNAAVLQFVLSKNALDVNNRDDQGNTVLHKVCGFNVNYDAEAARDLYKKVKLLLDAGADPSVTNDKDETPLMLAQQDNLKVKSVELLMRQ